MKIFIQGSTNIQRNFFCQSLLISLVTKGHSVLWGVLCFLIKINLKGCSYHLVEISAYFCQPYRRISLVTLKWKIYIKKWKKRGGGEGVFPHISTFAKTAQNNTYKQWQPPTHQCALTHRTDLPTPKYFCQYSEQSVHIFRFFTGFFCGSPPLSQNKTVSKVNFFYHSSCKNNVRTHIFTYTETLHSDDFILFTFVKVILNWRTHNTFSKSNAPCVLFSLMPPPFLNDCCLVAVCFLGFMHSSSSSSVLCSHSPSTALNSNPPNRKMANFRKVLMQSWCSLF